MVASQDPGSGAKRGRGGLPKGRSAYNLKSRIVSQLRRLFLWHPGLKEVRDRCRVTRGVYRCEGCFEAAPAKGMRCDHIVPVVGLEGFVDWNTYISRMFDVIPQGIQYLCRDCHDKKTASERVERKTRRRNAKAS